ncbi:cysteine hydrolase [Rhizobium sp. CG5]|uniref:cysteine hydrolase family protein n=1 Tax=Rhizobium sp. CG5 TaxID=2726076 RepID=UPI002033FEF5|nr:isochorismatase family cysteine hydrolase [Rhizobium sp. CG5]MCM2473439.1 cysteine hydrolase [Rhizobium sp. CG5]
MQKKQNPMLVGQPVLIVVDIQKSAFMDDGAIPLMPGMVDRMLKARRVIDAAREGGVPIIFLQESHRKSGVDYGREMDGDEDEHLREDWEGTKLASEEIGLRDDDYVIVKRRYSGFIGTDLSILLRGLKAETLVMLGGLTNICVHYTFADGHQNDYHCRVVDDCVAGSSIEAHDAALANMEYLQHGARRSSDEIVAAFRTFSKDRAA